MTDPLPPNPTPRPGLLARLGERLLSALIFWAAGTVVVGGALAYGFSLALGTALGLAAVVMVLALVLWLIVLNLN